VDITTANIEKFLGNLIPSMGAGGGVVGIDIGGSFIKVVQLHKKGGKAVLDTYGEIALGPLSGLEVGQATTLTTDKIVAAIKDLFTEAKVTAKHVVFSLPLSSTLLTVIQMPDIGEAKLKDMIPLEARKYIPTAVSEVSLSHWIIPRIPRTYIDPDEEERMKSAPPQVEVLLAAVHNDVLAKYNEIAKKIGASTTTLEIEVFAMIRSTLGHDPAPTMILDIGAANTKVVIVEEGIVRSSHLINVGSQDVTLALSRSKGLTMLRAEEIKREVGLLGDPNDPAIAEITRLAVERIFTEASRLSGAYEREKRVTIQKVILSGGGVLLKGMLDLAQKTFGAEVVMGNAFEKADAPAVLEPLLRESGPEFAVAMGLALRKL
jgi:type IV pilus assembly protein PilM